MRPGFRRLLLPLALAAALLWLGAAALPVQAQSGLIQGQVLSPTGFPLPNGTVVRLYDPTGQTVHGETRPDLNTGAFQIGPVPRGLYLLRAIPPANSGLTPSLPKPVIVMGSQPVNAGQLLLTRPQIVGTVYAPDGHTPAEAQVLVFAGDRPLDRVPTAGGRFQVGGLPPGTYQLQADPTGDQPYWRSARQSVDVTLFHSQTVSLTLGWADLWGVAQDAAGHPVAGARVLAARRDGTHQADLTNAHGFWSLGDLPAGTYWLAALPPADRPDLLPPHPFTLTLPGATNPLTLTFTTPAKTVTGTVQTQTGQPVFHAEVVARRAVPHAQARALTDAQGEYQLNLGPGLWALSVHPISDTQPSTWVFPAPPQMVFFHLNDQPESRQQDFTVQTADAHVIGRVTLPDGSPPPFTVTVALYNPEGVGRHTTIGTDGAFQIDLPSGGYRVAVHPHDPGYLGPVMEPVQVPPGGTLDLGTLQLLARDALISGTVRSETGAGVADVPIVAWRPGAPGTVRTRTASDGSYAIALSGGTWHVQPAPPPDQPYFYQGSGWEGEVPAGGNIPNVDFTLQTATAIVQGSLVDTTGEPVTDADGWVSARRVTTPTLQLGAPVQQGTFSLWLPAGTYRLAVHLPPGSPYTSAAERRVTVSAGQSTVITLTVQRKDARITGGLYNPRQQQVVTGVPGAVAAWQGDNWVAAPIDPGNGTFQMEVAAGLWHLTYRLDPRAGYVRLIGGKNVPVAAGQTAVVSLPVLPKDGTITGTVTAPDGSPLPGITVVARGTQGAVQDLRLRTRTGTDGRFHLAVPSGNYRVTALGGDPAWVHPVETAVQVPANGVVGGLTLAFRQADAVLQGTLTVSNTTRNGRVLVWAWSDDGGFVQAHFPVTATGSQASGPYRLDVVSGTVWHVGAAYQTTNAYWYGEGTADVQGSPTTLDLTLNGPHVLPAPVVVTFDAGQPQRVRLADGTEIFIPGGALPVSGTVTLRVVPIATLPHQHHTRLLKYGYAFLASDADGQPIEAHFNQEVVIRFPYDEADLTRLGLNEDALRPAYYSTTDNAWVVPVSYVVDTDANIVTMQIDHFTDFALTAPNASPTYSIFLPLIMR